MPGWFHFSFPDFCYAFLSVLLEGVPFILLGTLISGIIDQFLPARLMARLLPRNAFLGTVVSGLLGLIFPMCECGVVPVIRRLIAKGLPVSHAVTYMLAAPIVNPIVAVSTYVAFSGQDAAVMTSYRMLVGFVVAVIVGLAVQNLPLSSVLRSSVLESALAFGASAETTSRPLSLGLRLAAALRVGISDFFDVMRFFIAGVAVAALFSTGVNQELLLPLATNPWLATATLMGFAMILSLCSTSDAFIAASTLAPFPFAAKLAFLVFGPMMDLKLLFIYSSVFRTRFVIGLLVGLFVLIGLICLRLGGLQP